MQPQQTFPSGCVTPVSYEGRAEIAPSDEFEFMERKMKKLLLATAALVLAGPALAADLPRASEPVAPAYIAPMAFNWTGFYVGANAGYGFGGKFDGFGLSGADGFVGGAQAGFNYQYDPLVVGIEGEMDYSDVNDKSGAFRGDLNWRGSITPRIGF